jgi:hypothetical protein
MKEEVENKSAGVFDIKEELLLGRKEKKVDEEGSREEESYVQFAKLVHHP